MTERASGAAPEGPSGAWTQVLHRRLAGLATVSPDGIVRSREGALSAWLPEVGRSCFESPILYGFDEDLVTLRQGGAGCEPIVLPSVRLVDPPGAPRCHILITWDPESGEHAILTTIDQVDRPIDYWVRQQKRDQRLLEERLIVASRELERVNEDLRQFTSIAAHDLQAPLRQITAFAALLRTALRGTVPSDVSDGLDTIESCANRLTRMITGLLDHARLRSGQFPFEPVDLNEIASQACRNLNLDIAACAAVVTVDTLPKSNGSSVLLVNLFQNLIANALRYRSPERAPRIAITAGQGAGSRPLIAICDNGVGVPAQYSEAIFGSFVRVPRPRTAGGGVGLGLGICRRIAELHGWGLALDTSYVSGARFCIDVRPRTDHGVRPVPQDDR